MSIRKQPESNNSKNTMQSKLWKIILIVALPLMIVIAAIAFTGVIYALQYNAILNNVTTASDFNRDFKYNVDLKMYYYVIDSQYSEGLPLEEVRSAESIARTLIDTTTEKDSLRQINIVLNLCHKLERNMQHITETEGYDSRMDQLNTNIYGMTEMIQEYIYTYVYYEAAHLDALQTAMITNMIIVMGLILVLSLVLLYFLLAHSRKLSRRIVDPIDKLCERLEAIGKGRFGGFSFGHRNSVRTYPGNIDIIFGNTAVYYHFSGYVLCERNDYDSQRCSTHSDT